VGLLQSVTARGLAAVATVFAQLVLKGLNPCLEVEDEGRQLPHQGQHSFFALHVGGMDIFWGRQFSRCHIIYYALFLPALHEGILNFTGVPEQLPHDLEYSSTPGRAAG
jgi:hypothetical protein